MNILFMILFFVVSVLHLYFAWVGNQKGRNITKPLLVLSLLLSYMFGTNEIRVTLVLALIFGWLGDILLMSNKQVAEYKLGPTAFIIGHIFYIALFLNFKGFTNMKPYTYIILLIYALWFIVMIKQIYPHMKNRRTWIFYGGLIYCTIIGLMSFSAYSLIWSNSTSTILPFIGSLLFIFSDTFIGYKQFVHKFKRCDFVIMITYIAAQFLIVIDFI